MANLLEYLKQKFIRDQLREEAVAWCKVNVSTDTWVSTWNPGPLFNSHRTSKLFHEYKDWYRIDQFYFKDEQDAVMFRLKFSDLV